eukprot:475834_1
MIEEEIELKSNNVKEKTQIKQFCSKQLDTFYDILAILISIFDIITDVWIMIEWYYHGRIIFFAISLTILILANFAYLVVFFSRYGILNPIFICCCGCFMLPIAPFLSFFMYIVDTFNIHCDFCCFDIYAWSSDLGEGNESRKWMENKLSKHIGFLFEGIMEAFPQCILQMIAIVYFNESDIISIISIIISMISIASKSLIFSAVTSINIKTMIFTWFYFVSDIFGLFFILSFVFYGGNHINQNIIHILRSIWLYKLAIFTAPTCLILSIPVYIWGVHNLHDKAGGWHLRIHGLAYWCLMIVCFIFVIPLWLLGMVIGLILLETACYSYIAYIVYKMGHGRIPANQATRTWLELIDWIKESSDPIVRICCVNRQLLLMKNTDRILHEYLEKKEHSTQYNDVTFKSLKKMYFYSVFWKRFKDTFFQRSDEIIGLLVNILLIWYMVSRFIVLIFPVLIIIVIVSVDGYSGIIYDLPMFQMIMLIIMFVMILIMIIIICVVWSEERIIFYILPLRSKKLYMNIDHYLCVLVNSYYDRLIIKPFIKIVLFDVFGND